ncbi:7-cyano-7-deazaguanine synthase [Candidatus Woesearchaeota archaeon]|nr:7-cyano-7-deazaguanine synthase [Candidatus Woesearchaeota archaeon]
MKNALVLCSGGLDSVVATYEIRKRYDKIKFLFFDYNQRSLKEEEFCSRKICEKLNGEFVKINLKWLGNISGAALNNKGDFPETTEKDLENTEKQILNWWVPARNSVFLINALAFAESEFLNNNEKYDIIIGLKNEGREHMKDTTPKFVEKVNELAKEATNHGDYKVVAPLINLDKIEVIKLGEELEVPFEFTYSCYIGNNFSKKKLVHCGKCLNCMLRKKSFYWSGINDRTNYAL